MEIFSVWELGGEVDMNPVLSSSYSSYSVVYVFIAHITLKNVHNIHTIYIHTYMRVRDVSDTYILHLSVVNPWDE